MRKSTDKPEPIAAMPPIRNGSLGRSLTGNHVNVFAHVSASLPFNAYRLILIMPFAL